MGVLNHDITEAARRQYETIKRQTQAEVKNSFTRLIQGTEEVRSFLLLISAHVSLRKTIPKNIEAEYFCM